MRNRIIFLHVMGRVGVLILCTTFASCGLQDSVAEEGAEPAELRVYKVPAAHRDGLREMLQSALGSGDSRLGRIINGPGGTLLATAPARLQDGIEQVLGPGL